MTRRQTTPRSQAGTAKRPQGGTSTGSRSSGTTTAHRSHNGTATMSRSEAGRKGAEARWGKTYRNEETPHKSRSSHTTNQHSHNEDAHRATRATTPRSSTARYTHELNRDRDHAQRNRFNHHEEMVHGRSNNRTNPNRESRHTHEDTREYNHRFEAGHRGTEARWDREENRRHENHRNYPANARHRNEDMHFDRYGNRYEEEGLFFLDLEIENQEDHHGHSTANRRNHARESSNYEMNAPRNQGSRNVYGRELEHYGEYHTPTTRVWNAEYNEENAFDNHTRIRNNRR